MFEKCRFGAFGFLPTLTLVPCLARSKELRMLSSEVFKSAAPDLGFLSCLLFIRLASLKSLFSELASFICFFGSGFALMYCKLKSLPNALIG